MTEAMRQKMESLAENYDDNFKFTGSYSSIDIDNAYKAGFTAAVELMEKENKRLKEYQDHIYDYVQCGQNTSLKFLGYHVAESLVRDHKDLKAREAKLKKQLKACLEFSWVGKAHESCSLGLQHRKRVIENLKSLNLEGE